MTQSTLRLLIIFVWNFGVGLLDGRTHIPGGPGPGPGGLKFFKLVQIPKFSP